MKAIIALEKACIYSRRIACALVAAGVAGFCAGVNAHPVFLGPVNPGAESGHEGWYRGTLGGGSVTVDHKDPATGKCDFRIGINDAASYGTNHADFRSHLFSLGLDGKVRGPFTFSFAYKLPDKVNPGDNIQVFFRFYGQRESDFIDQNVIEVGSSTDDSEMTGYKTMTVKDIAAPRGAVNADVWVAANIFAPWTSGYAQSTTFPSLPLRQRPGWRFTLAREFLPHWRPGRFGRYLRAAGANGRRQFERSGTAAAPFERGW